MGADETVVAVNTGADARCNEEAAEGGGWLEKPASAVVEAAGNAAEAAATAPGLPLANAL